MHIRWSKAPQREQAKVSFNDQHFLLNFIMSAYLGPDVYSDNPRRSLMQRIADRLPPYASNNLGSSFLSFSQLENLYYYVLRNADASLVLEPKLLHMYLKGNLSFPTTESLEDHRQFTSLFPLSVHEQKRYLASYEIVKGIVLIDNPVTSYMKEEDLERFRRLSGLEHLKIDKVKCLSYQHGYQKPSVRQEAEPSDVTTSGREIAESSSDGKEISSAIILQIYKRCCRGDYPPCRPPISTLHNGEGLPGGTSNMPASPTLPITILPEMEHPMSHEIIVLTGTASREVAGPPIGIVDIGVSKAAYFFQVALPGVRRDFCQFSCEIESDGKVQIAGSTTGGKTIKKRSRVFQMKFRQLCPPGPFTLSFNLPGPVDPRLSSPNFRSDGIFEAVVIWRR